MAFYLYHRLSEFLPPLLPGSVFIVGGEDPELIQAWLLNSHSLHPPLTFISPLYEGTIPWQDFCDAAHQTAAETDTVALLAAPPCSDEDFPPLCASPFPTIHLAWSGAGSLLVSAWREGRVLATLPLYGFDHYTGRILTVESDTAETITTTSELIRRFEDDFALTPLAVAHEATAHLQSRLDNDPTLRGYIEPHATLKRIECDSVELDADSEAFSASLTVVFAAGIDSTAYPASAHGTHDSNGEITSFHLDFSL